MFGRAEKETSYISQAHKLTRCRSEEVSSITFLYRTNTKIIHVQQARANITHSQREIKEILDPQTQSVREHRGTLFLLLRLIPCHRCEKSERESCNSHHYLTI